MNFHLTLPSDNSKNYFPDNKVSHFITRLPKCLELTGKWVVGISEIIFPHTWYNVNETNNLVEYILAEKSLKFRISPGFYPTVPDILNAISVKLLENKINFTFNEVTKRVQIKVTGDASVILHPGMAELLGFDSMEIGTEEEGAEISMESPYIPDPCARYRVLMIYTDIIEPQIVGDILAPLLKIVNVSGKDGEMVLVQYDRPHYLPVSRKTIETLEIVIRTHMGDLVPFERGRAYVKLHFRQETLS